MIPMNYSNSPAPSYAAIQRHLKVESPGARNPLSRASSRNMNGPLYKQSADKVVLVRRKRKGAGAVKQLTRWFVENQIGSSFNLLALLFLAHICVPKARVHTAKYFNLAYLNPESGKYGLGRDDAYFILFCVFLFTCLRAASMEHVFAPFAKAMGVSKRKDVTRFSEQAWLLVYYSFFWSPGLYMYYNSPYWLSLENLWTDWPNRELTGLMKGYMLGQLSFWVQQLLVINIEERRKDHWQMFTHHLVTIGLIYSSYRYHHTRVGNVILVLMDVVDLFLPTAKCLKYLGFTTACDLVFTIFMLSWFIARHVLYLVVCYSVWAHTPNLLPTGCFTGSNASLTGPFDPPTGKGLGLIYILEPLWRQNGLVCYNQTVKWSFLSALLFLQGITLCWFGMIVKVAVGVLKSDGAEGPRSDDEADGLEDHEEVYEEIDLETEVGVGGLDLRSWERRSGVKITMATATGVSLSGHSDRRDILGRVGFEKLVD